MVEQSTQTRLCCEPLKKTAKEVVRVVRPVFAKEVSNTSKIPYFYSC